MSLDVLDDCIVFQWFTIRKIHNFLCARLSELRIDCNLRYWQHFSLYNSPFQCVAFQVTYFCDGRIQLVKFMI